MVTASVMARCDFENSQISAQDTVGVAGDDIMFHIHIWEAMQGMNYQVRGQEKPDDILFELKVENILHAICN